MDTIDNKNKTSEQKIDSPEIVSVSPEQEIKNTSESIVSTANELKNENATIAENIKTYPGAEPSDIADVQNATTEMNEGVIQTQTEATGEITKVNNENTAGDQNQVDVEESSHLAEKYLKSSENNNENTKAFNENEQAYLDKHRDKDKLKIRYEDPTTKAEYVLNQIQEFSKMHGAEYKKIPELEGKSFSPETKVIILKAVQEQIDTLLLSKDKTKGRFQEKKHMSVSNEVKRYADLIEQAQAEGDVDQNISAEAVLKKLEENVATLAMQDEAAAENLMGDHGIRHLVEHNIKISEDILNQVKKRGGEVKAVDRIIAHQIMIDHDLGYAMDPVRKSINDNGIKGQDAGHNLLAAKFVKERSQNSEDTLNKIFSADQVATIHSGILNHDSSKVEIRLDNAPESRRANIESAIHIADNTHAFEDKLPELLYAVPDSLKTMRLLKMAGEIGDDKLIEELKLDLAGKINASEEYTDADKNALTMAVKGLTGENYKFSVGRICGNKPEVFINETGGVEIKVEESAIHQEAVKLFGQKSYDQLHKFIADLTGRSKAEVAAEMEDPNKTEIGNDKIKIGLKLGEAKAQEKTDYQRNIETLISEPEFRVWAEKDDIFAKRQKMFEEVLKKTEEAEKASSISDAESIKKIKVSKMIEKLKDARRDLIKNKN